MNNENHVHWVLEVSVSPEHLSDFQGVMSELVAATKNEPETLVYEWCFSADNATCAIYESYASSESVLTHLSSFGGYAERFLAAATPKRLSVYGQPTDAARKALKSFGPEYYDLKAGFFR